jgi:flagellar hook-associated protein 2
VIVGHLATSSRATSTAAIGTAITGADLGASLASLNLPGTVTGGTFSMVVDGKVVHATLGDPATTTLGDALSAIGTALTSQVQANEGAGSTAVVSAAVVGNRLEVSLADSTTSHSVIFGVGGDTSNVLGVLGLSGGGTATLAAGSAVTGRSALGVARTSVALDGAGLAGLASGPGTLTINGAAIAYDTTTDSLSTIIGRINASAAGVVASVDRTNDRLVLTAKSGGARPIGIEDTGTLASALRLAPGTTDAQVFGTQAQFTVDGRAFTSDTNNVSAAIPGVTLTLLAEGSSTVTITPDSASLKASLGDFVAAFNALADKLDVLTANEKGTTPGTLAGANEIRGMALSLRRTLLGTAPTGSAYTSLSQIGVTTGVVGSAKGTTNRLQLDAARLESALANDPSAVASLLNSATGAIKPFHDAITAWTRSGGGIDKALESITSQLKMLDRREEQMQARLDAKQTALERKFAALEAAMAKYQTQSNSLSTTVNQMSGDS